MSGHIDSLPANADLPKAVHADADEWRRLVQRADELAEQSQALQDDIRAAEHADAEALRKAAVAGGALPDDDTAAPIRRKLGQVRTALKAAETAREAAAKALVFKMRKLSVRDHLAADLKQRVNAAADAYTKALADAEQSIARALVDLEHAAANVSTVQDLDKGWELSARNVFRIQTPVFTESRQSVADIRSAVESLAGATARPTQRTVRLAKNGQVFTLDAPFTAQMYGRGEIAEWLDGYEPEIPVKPHVTQAAALAFYNKTFGGAA
ncbi:hypothetical protein ABZV67_10665 [Streptomyces sp. NPDC005065]|uniref:hypothetical protein n=1 Tax=Streptomyces sp. NPDC005065 TaxID=3154461 RepID=UPI0033BAB971